MLTIKDIMVIWFITRITSFLEHKHAKWSVSQLKKITSPKLLSTIYLKNHAQKIGNLVFTYSRIVENYAILIQLNCLFFFTFVWRFIFAYPYLS